MYVSYGIERVKEHEKNCSYVQFIPTWINIHELGPDDVSSFSGIDFQ